MLVDSHCHLDFAQFGGKIEEIQSEMRLNGVTHALCVSVNLTAWPRVMALAEAHANLYASVGVHPDQDPADATSVTDLVERSAHPKVVAIGETGLDYFRATGDCSWQRERFRTHVRAARESGLPLIVHTREAGEDTLAILREEGAGRVSGVMHCFTESAEFAAAALDLGFYISFSGIVTFKNAGALKDTAARVPLERLLVETDAPYLAPVPYRGKTNRPGLVRYVAEEIARLREADLDTVAKATTANFFSLFSTAKY